MAISKRAITTSLCLLGISAFLLPVSSYASNQKGQKGGVYFQLEGFDVQPHNSFLDSVPYANEFENLISEDPEISEGGTFRFQDRDYQWGFRAAIGYDIPDCNGCYNYGFSLEYTQFNTDDHRQTGPLVNFLGEGELFPTLTIDNESVATAVVKFDTRYNTVDLLAHKNIFWCNSARFQLFVGGRYLNLNEKFNIVYSDDTDPTETIIQPVRFKTRFNGAGPRLGANLFFPFGCYFGLVTEASGSLIYGQNDSSYFSRRVDIDTVTAEETIALYQDQHKNTGNVVPALSGKIALAFNTTFRNCSSFSIEAGYRGDKYFKVSDVNALQSSRLPVATGQFNPFQSDFDVQGPYVAVAVHL